MLIEFRILGPLDVRVEGEPVALGGSKPRGLLAMLLLHRNEAVGADRLALALWGEDAPAGAGKTVQVHVSRLRKALGSPGVVETTAAGYRLRVRPGELDADRFADAVDAGRRALDAGRPEEALALLDEALALWRGPPLADLAFEPFAQADIARLEEQRLTALEDRAEAGLAAGRHVALVGELRRLAAEHPARERPAAQLVLALYRSGRQAEALEAYRDARRAMVEQAGVEPGPELRRLHDAVLHQDPSLELEPRGELPPELDAGADPPLVGRGAELARLRAHWEQARAGAGRLVVLCGPDGMGKTRLAAELAGEVHRAGAAVRYATGQGGSPALLAALDAVRAATRPTLLVVDGGGDGVPAALTDRLADVPALVLVNAREAGGNGAIALGPLDAAAVREIAARAAPAQEAPVDELLEASGGVPRRVHEVVRRWARREAERRVDAAAGRTAADRAGLRTEEAELERGVLALQAAQERTAARRDEEAPVVCPYKGLASFDVADAPFFFGRERLVAELVARLVGAPLLGVVGPSGSGKSSVVRAGLLPALADGVLPGSDTWTQVVIRPGAHPMRELHRRTAGVDGRIVVAVDQFEEVFTACRDEVERAAFLAALADGDHGERTVVLAIRADFYGRCAAYPQLSAQLTAHHVLVGAMRRDELRRAVERPAAKVGLRVEPELAEALVEDVQHEPGALPMLSTALMELWQRRDGRRLRLTTYEATGGVRGAVARHAEEAFARLDADQKDSGRRVLLRLAADDGEGGVERRRVPLEELGDDADVAAVLTDERLLTVDAGAVELAHEALLREWPRLRGWLEEDAEGRRLHRRLAAAAREWDHGGRDRADVYRGARLAAALEWRGRHEPDLNSAEREFLDAAEGELRTARRNRRRALTLGVGALIVITGISIVLAVRGVQRSRFEQRAAASRSLAIQALSNAGDDLSLAGLLALEAVRREPTVEARSAVLALLPGFGGYRRLGPPFTDDTGLDGVAISPDGRLLAGAANDGTVRLWSVATHRRLGGPLRGHTEAVNTVEFSPDGTMLASASDDGTVRLWDARSRRPLGAPLRGHPERVRSLDFNPDGTLLASGGSWAAEGGSAGGGQPSSARLWDVARRRAVGPPLLAATSGLESVSFSSDGLTLAAYGLDGRLHRFDVAGGSALPGLDLGNPQEVGDTAWSPDGRTMVAFGDFGFVRLFDARTARPLGRRLAGRDDVVTSAAFSPDGGTLATGGFDGTIRLWAVATQRPRGVLVPPAERSRPGEVDLGIAGLVFSPDGGMLASTSDRSGLELWDVRPRGALGRPLRGHEGGIRAVAFLRDGTLASGGVDGTLRLWDGRTQRALGRPLEQPALVLGTAATPDGRMLVTAGEDGMVRRWDAASRAPLGHPMAGHRGPVKAVAVSPDGETIASGGDDDTVRLWDAETGKALGPPLPSRVGTVNGVAFDGAGELVAAAGQDGGVALWDAGSRERLGSLTGPVGFVNAVAFRSGGKTLAGVGQDGSVWLWDVDSRRPLGPPLTGHTDVLETVAFTPDGRTLATAGADRRIRLWDVETRQALGVPLESHTAAVHTLAFSPDGRRLASAGEDETVRLWDELLWSDDGEALERRVCGAVQRNLTRREWAKFIPDEPYRRTCPDVR